MTTQARTLVIGTRASTLALAQVALVKQALQQRYPDCEISVQHITTKGDVILDRPLKAIGEKGLFITEIEAALRNKHIDIAVHSAKDLPTEIPADMQIAAYLPREDARDAIVGMPLAALPQGARVGTSSTRRACQLRHVRPDLTILDLRGNVDTRLHKLHDGHYDAIVLAVAGLKRLGLEHEIAEMLNPALLIPAVAQGAIAIETRADDEATAAFVRSLHDQATGIAVQAERAFLATLGGGCSLPAGAYATCNDTMIEIAGMIGSLDGTIISDRWRGRITDPAALGRELALSLLVAGGAEMIRNDSISAGVKDGQHD